MALVNEKRLKELDASVAMGRQFLNTNSPLHEAISELIETVRALRTGFEEALDLALGDFVDYGDEEPQNDEHREYRRLRALLDTVS